MQKWILKMRHIGVMTILAIAVSGCDRSGDTEQPSPAAQGVDEGHLTEEQRQQLSQRTDEVWQAATPKIAETLTEATQLLKRVDTLLRTPTTDTLRAAQEQWQAAALAYQPLNFYDSLAELQAQQLQSLRDLTFSVAARPIQPGYLDNFGPYTYSGLVHDIGLPLTAETLREQHGMTDAEDATLGLYALQFMLFGYNAEEPRLATDFAPQQALTNEHREQGFNSVEELPNYRRRQLVRIQAQLLAEDLQRLYELWQPSAEKSLHGVFMSYSPLQRYLLLLRSARLELSQVQTELGKLHAARTTGESAPSAENLRESANLENTAFANIAPAGFLAARLQHVREIAKIMQVDDALQANLKLAHHALRRLANDKEAGALEEASAAIALALDQLAAEQQRHMPQAEQADSRD